MGQVSAISFSENGYYLATAADDASVKIWDLRKLKNFKTIQLEGNYEVKDLCFDQSGTYLAVAGSDVRLVAVIFLKGELMGHLLRAQNFKQIIERL
jgi:pre-mRNA-processing factor 19